MPRKVKRTNSRKNSKSKNKSKKNKGNNSKKVKCVPGTTPLIVNGRQICVGRCPHSGGLIKYDPITKDLKCMMHGSRFDAKTGKVKMGSGPAVSNLKIIK